MMIKTSMLRQRLTVITFSSSLDGQGGLTSTSSTVSTVWAQVKRKKARQNLIDGGVFEQEIFDIIMRYETGKAFKPETHRFQYQGIEMTINARTRIDQIDSYLTFTCTAKNLN